MVERHTDVGFAVVILTPDDVGASKDKHSKSHAHGRWNVMLDLCYFLGKLGHARVFALLKGKVGIPPEIADAPSTTMDAAGRWHVKLAKALRAAGMDLDAIM